MDLIVTDKVLNTDPIKNLLRQGEANVDCPVIVLDKTYNSIDISGYSFTLRAASDKNTLVSRVLQKEVLTDKIRLTWEVVPEYTAVPGQLHITIVGTSATGEDIIKITADAINVLSDPSSWSAPSPDVVADAINQITAILVDATAEANRAAAEADRLIDVGVRFRVMGAYDTLAALQAAVTAPAVGDAYQVGTTDADRVIYLWDGTTWINMGAIQGTQGPPGPQGQPGEAGPKGDPSTVCGKGADASGNIVLDTTDLLMTGYTKPISGGDIAGTDTLMQAVQRLAYNVGLLSNPNMLDNWDFRNPVNQRGNALYSAIGYTIDRWRISTAGVSVSVNAGYITFSGSTKTAPFAQIQENLRAGTYTMSCLVQGVAGKSMALQIGSLYGVVTLDGSLQVVSVTKTIDATQLNNGYTAIFPTYDDGGGSANLYAAKLEPGSISTLPNDLPANHGEQLKLCQRYYLPIANYARQRATLVISNIIHFSIPTPVTMRATPTITGTPVVQKLDNAPQTGFVFSVGTRAANCITIIATKDAHGLTDATLNPNDIAFSAEL